MSLLKKQFGTHSGNCINFLLNPWQVCALTINLELLHDLLTDIANVMTSKKPYMTFLNCFT